MKTNAIIRIILFGLGILILGSLLVGGVLLHLFAVNGGISEVMEIISDYLPTVDGTVASKGTINAEDVKNMEIHWTSGSVIIQHANVPNIIFSETDGLKKSDQMVWKLKGSTLVINCSRYQINIGKSKEKDLVITLPLNCSLKEVEISTVSANITADSLGAGKVSIEGVSGKCDFTGKTVLGQLKVETVDGDVTFNGYLWALDYEGVEADFRGNFVSAPDSIDMSTVDGSIDITLPADTGFTAELETVSGNFSSDFDFTSSGKRYTCGDGKCAIEIEGVSGSINLRKAN